MWDHKALHNMVPGYLSDFIGSHSDPLWLFPSDRGFLTVPSSLLVHSGLRALTLTVTSVQDALMEVSLACLPTSLLPWFLSAQGSSARRPPLITLPISHPYHSYAVSFFSQHLAPRDIILNIFIFKLFSSPHLPPAPRHWCANPLREDWGFILFITLSPAPRYWVWACEPPNTYLLAGSVNGVFCNAITKLKILLLQNSFRFTENLWRYSSHILHNQPPLLLTSYVMVHMLKWTDIDMLLLTEVHA